MMINKVRFIWQLLVLAAFLLILGAIVIPGMEIDFSLNTFIVLVGAVTAVNLISYLVMTAGIRKNNKDGVVVLMAGIGLKFILYLLVILVFWLVTKNLSKPFIITFFALYLIFTFLLAVHLIKVLKNK